MIKTKKVESYAEIFICDKCKIREMQPTGENIWTDPPLFKHKCCSCGEEQHLNEKHPAIKYRIIE